MKTIKAFYEIENPLEDFMDLEWYLRGMQNYIEKVARTCYKSKVDELGSDRFVKMLIDKGHEAMVEHTMLSIRFITDRGISHEIVRHREASFGQESTRYCNYSLGKFGNEIQVIDIQDAIKLDSKMSKLDAKSIQMILAEWLLAMEDAEKHYMKMLELGASPQIARGVLPTSVKTEIVMTANFREWRHFFKLRTPKEAHPQMRELTIPLLKELQEKLPVVFNDIEVEE